LYHVINIDNKLLLTYFSMFSFCFHFTKVRKLTVIDKTSKKKKYIAKLFIHCVDLLLRPLKNYLAVQNE